MGEDTKEHSGHNHAEDLRDVNRLRLSESLEQILEEIEKLGAAANLAAVIVHCNDTYFVDERPPQIPGMSRIATLVHTIRKTVARCTGEDRTLFLHSGDYLSPSAMSSAFDGSPMVELLKECGLNYATLGNHEFDFYGKPYDKLGVLRERLHELSPCVHVLANLESTEHSMIQRIAYWPQEKPFLAITGLAGHQTIQKAVGAGFRVTGPWQDIAREILKEVRGRPGLGGLVVLSHMERDEDKELQGILGRGSAFRGYQYLLGGHDHGIYWAERDRHRCFLSKCESNFKTISVFLLSNDGIAATSLPEDYVGRLRRETPSTGAAAEHGLSREDAWAFASAGKPPGWLASQVGMRSKESLADEILSDYRNLESSELRDDFRVAFEKRITEVFDNSWGVRPANEDFAMGVLSADVVNIAQARALRGFPASRHVMSTGEHLFGIKRDAHASQLITKWQSAMESKYGANSLIADFSSVAPPRGLDANDNSLRSRSTDFGNFVADAIRAATGADVVLLNGGAFRIDGHIPPKVTRHILKDVFVYDYAGALSLIEMSAEVLWSFFEHAMKKGDHGAFLQVSESEDTAKRRTGTVKVVLITHMLRNDEDGYQSLLREQLGIAAMEGSQDKLLAQFGAHALTEPIVALVEGGGPAVSYSSEIRLKAVRARDEKEARADDFVELVRIYREACAVAKLSEADAIELLKGFARDIPDKQAVPAIEQARVALYAFLRRHSKEQGRKFVEQFWDYFAHHGYNAFSDGVPYQRYVEAAGEWISYLLMIRRPGEEVDQVSGSGPDGQVEAE